MPFVVLAALIVITALWLLSLPRTVLDPARAVARSPIRRVRGAGTEPVIRDHG